MKRNANHRHGHFMRTMTLFRGIFLCLACAVAMQTFNPMRVSAASQDATDASEAIRRQFSPLLSEYSRLFMGGGEADCIDFAVKQNMVSPGLKELLLKEARFREKSQEVGHLDFDFFFNAQDSDGKPLSIVSITKAGDTYLMKVSNGFPGEKPYDFLLVNDSGRWVIDDVRYFVQGAEPTTLRKILTTD